MTPGTSSTNVPGAEFLSIRFFPRWGGLKNPFDQERLADLKRQAHAGHITKEQYQDAMLALYGIFDPPSRVRGRQLMDEEQADDERIWPRGRVVVVNHRGLSQGFPENTLAAFRNSIALGVDAIELDLRGTRDRIPVIMHDPTVDRTTNGSGAVEMLPLSQVKRLDAGSHIDKKFRRERVPTYEEVLALIPKTGIHLLLDIKPSATLDLRSVVRLTEKHGAILNVIIGARTVKDILQFRVLNPNLRALGFVKNQNDIKSFITAGAEIIRLWPKWVQAEPNLVRRVHKLGKAVWVTANNAGEKELLALIRLQVNGILTDRPEILAKLIQRIDAGKILL